MCFGYYTLVYAYGSYQFYSDTCHLTWWGTDTPVLGEGGLISRVNGYSRSDILREHPDVLVHSQKQSKSQTYIKSNDLDLNIWW